MNEPSTYHAREVWYEACVATNARLRSRPALDAEDGHSCLLRALFAWNCSLSTWDGGSRPTLYTKRGSAVGVWNLSSFGQALKKQRSFSDDFAQNCTSALPGISPTRISRICISATRRICSLPIIICGNSGCTAVSSQMSTTCVRLLLLGFFRHQYWQLVSLRRHHAFLVIMVEDNASFVQIQAQRFFPRCCDIAQ